MDILLSQPDNDTFKGIRDKAMLELLYATGIRVSEMVALNVDNLDLQLGYLHLGSYSSNERIVPIGRVALEYIIIYIEDYRENV